MITDEKNESAHIAADNDTAMRAEVKRLALRMAELGISAAEDEKQFMRYIVSEKSGRGETETCERVFEKLDTKAYRELTAAIKDLWSIAQDSGDSEKNGIVVVLGAAEEAAK